MAFTEEDLIAAALIEDDEDEQVEGDEPKGTTPKTSDEPKSDDDPKGDEPKGDEDEPNDEDEPKGDEADKPKDGDEPKGDDPKPDAKKDEDPDKEERKTRRERREERKNFIESIRRDNAPKEQPNLNKQPYNPLDYSKADQFDEKDLETDRKTFGDHQFAEGAERERFVQNQERFWDNVTLEHRLLTSDPKYNFLNDKLADGTENPAFDEDRALDLNEHYLELVGYKETPVRNEQGQQLYNQQGQPLVSRTVDRTDLSWEKFVKAEVDRLERYAAERAEEAADSAAKNLDTQRKSGGVRPGGSSRSSTRKFTAADIAKMSDEELEKYDEEIDRQILAQIE